MTSTPPPITPPAFGLDTLCALVDLPVRTVRYYIQIGLVDRPEGLNRGARYTAHHLEQLLSIKKWQAAGLSLERIRAVLHEDTRTPPHAGKASGTIEIWSRMHVAPGIELAVEAVEAGLTTEQVRALFRAVMKAFQNIQVQNNTTGEDHEGV